MVLVIGHWPFQGSQANASMTLCHSTMIPKKSIPHAFGWSSRLSKWCTREDGSHPACPCCRPIQCPPHDLVPDLPAVVFCWHRQAGRGRCGVPSRARTRSFCPCNVAHCKQAPPVVAPHAPHCVRQATKTTMHARLAQAVAGWAAHHHMAIMFMCAGSIADVCLCDAVKCESTPTTYRHTCITWHVTSFLLQSVPLPLTLSTGDSCKRMPLASPKPWMQTAWSWDGFLATMLCSSSKLTVNNVVPQPSCARFLKAALHTDQHTHHVHAHPHACTYTHMHTFFHT